MIYADYMFYVSDYGGKLFSDEAEYKRFALQASTYIASHTYDRINEDILNEPKKAEKIKYACCTLCEAIKKHEDNGNKTSENVSLNGYSVNYSDKEKDISIQYQSILKKYLSGTGLLYRGTKGGRLI